MQELVSYVLYPKVFSEYKQHEQAYSDLTVMDTMVFFHGLEPGEVTRIEIEDGKTLFIKLVNISEPDENHTCSVVFELNGIRREVSVLDRAKGATGVSVQMADPLNPMEIGASIPGMVNRLMVKPGDVVKQNDVLAVIEAMKMETTVVCRADGVVEEIFVKEQQSVKAGELIIKMHP